MLDRKERIKRRLHSIHRSFSYIFSDEEHHKILQTAFRNPVIWLFIIFAFALTVLIVLNVLQHRDGECLISCYVYDIN